MKPIELVPADSQATVTAGGLVSHLCPFVDEADHGTVTITWRCNTSTVELHSLAAYLGGFTDRRIGHEDLVEEVFQHLRDAAPGVSVRSVTARFTTAGLGVEVSRAVPDHTVGT